MLPLCNRGGAFLDEVPNLLKTSDMNLSEKAAGSRKLFKKFTSVEIN
jgi:hypothetical protein